MCCNIKCHSYSPDKLKNRKCNKTCNYTMCPKHLEHAKLDFFSRKTPYLLLPRLENVDIANQHTQLQCHTEVFFGMKIKSKNFMLNFGTEVFGSAIFSFYIKWGHFLRRV